MRDLYRGRDGHGRSRRAELRPLRRREGDDETKVCPVLFTTPGTASEQPAERTQLGVECLVVFGGEHRPRRLRHSLGLFGGGPRDQGLTHGECGGSLVLVGEEREVGVELGQDILNLVGAERM